MDTQGNGWGPLRSAEHALGTTDIEEQYTVSCGVT